MYIYRGEDYFWVYILFAARVFLLVPVLPGSILLQICSMKPVTMKPEFWALTVALHTAFYQISGDEDCEETKERISTSPDARLETCHLMCNCRVRNCGDNFHVIDNNVMGDILTRGPRGGRRWRGRKDTCWSGESTVKLWNLLTVFILTVNLRTWCWGICYNSDHSSSILTNEREKRERREGRKNSSGIPQLRVKW